jgi:hypothetical protein
MKLQVLPANLQKRVLFLGFEFVGAKEFEAASCFFGIQTIIITLKEFEDVVYDDCLQVNLFFIVQIFRL